MKPKSDLKKLEELLGLDSMRVQVEIIFDPGKRKLRATAQNVWVRFPNKLRVLGAIYECEVKRGPGDCFMAVGEIFAVNDIAQRRI